MLSSVARHPHTWRITIYLFLVCAILWTEPSLAFKDGHVRPFGTKTRGSTIFPLWLWVLGAAVISYLAVFYVTDRML